MKISASVIIGAKGEKAMNKWGVRLIGYYFFVRAILTAYGLILSPFEAGGFFGFQATDASYTLPFIGSGKQIDFLALGEVITLMLIGYFILRLNLTARGTALIVLWPPTIYYGIYFILMTLVALFSFFSPEVTASETLTFFQWSREVNNPIILALAHAGFFLFYAIPTYFLMRKDVKQLFEKPVTIEESTNLIQGAKS
jgi:hypothetical protein